MKRLSSRDKLAARPVPDVAAPLKPNSLSTPAKAIPQWREWRLSPGFALAVLLAVIAILLCEPPAGFMDWLKALAAGVIVPGGAYAIVKAATGQWRVE